MAQDKQADDRRKAREDARKLAAQGVAERREATEEARAYANSQRGGRPTPTQEENDLAKVGALDIDAKEDDGSGPDRSTTVTATRVAAPVSKPAPYTTRTAMGSGADKKD